MQTQVKLEGSKEFMEALEKSRSLSKLAAFKFVAAMTFEVHSHIIKGIQRGPASGRTYRKYNPNRMHTASAAGEFPMSDTGRLANSVIKDVSTNKEDPKGMVGTNLDYGKYLELKPAATGGRPWLSRGFKEVSAKASDILERVTRSEMRK